MSSSWTSEATENIGSHAHGRAAHTLPAAAPSNSDPTILTSMHSLCCTRSLPPLPPDRRLTPKQLGWCCEALRVLKEKLKDSAIIHDEFNNLQAKRIRVSDMLKRCKIALAHGNLQNNRYTDVVPFDENRVVLNQTKHSQSSENVYINASFIKTGDSGKLTSFIATQGPLSRTVIDFWEMVLQCRCPVIVMLTELVDNHKMVKCVRYFPTNDDQVTCGKICVTNLETSETQNSLILRCLEVKNVESDGHQLQVLHIQYPEWPDHDVPVSTLAVREIIKRIFHLPPELGPVVVHCSAGIGRTGAFCIIYNTLQRIINGDLSALNLADTVVDFRCQRNGMVQTQAQYYFSYKAVADELEDLIARSNFNRQI